MPRALQKTFAAVALVIGLTIFVCGYRAFAKTDLPPLPPNEPGVRFCPPTLGEMIGAGQVAHKLGWLTLAVAGIALAAGSTLSLIPKREPT